MVKKRSLREKVTEKKEVEEKKAEGEKEEKEEKREHAADKSKWVIKIKKPNLKFLKSLKPLKPTKSLKSLKPLAIYFLLGAIAIIAAFFIFRGIIIGHVAFGDKVNISYSLELEDGTIIDSGSADFILGSISTEFGFISNKLDNVIKKMKAGEEKIIELEPADAFGEYDKQKIDTINRTTEFDKTFVAPISVEVYKQNFNKSPEIGDSLPYNQFWNVTIVGIGEETITLKHELKGGEVLPLEPGGNVSVHLEKDKIVLTFNPGKQLLVGDGLADVIDVTADEIILDYNVPLAGNIIIVKVKVNEIEKAVSKKEEDTCYGKYGLTTGTVIFYHAEWCSYCQKMIPIVKELEEEGYNFHWAETSKNEGTEVVQECFSDVLQGGIPQFICSSTKEIEVGEMPKANLKGFADKCKKAKVATVISKTITDQQKEITDFVNCLKKAGFRIYGANWCGYTKSLVGSFGGFDVVKPIYIECTEQQQLCQEKGIGGYPTLLINDRPYTGPRTFEGFAQATGCKAVQEIVEQSASGGTDGSCG